MVLTDEPSVRNETKLLIEKKAEKLFILSTSDWQSALDVISLLTRLIWRNFYLLFRSIKLKTVHHNSNKVIPVAGPPACQCTWIWKFDPKSIPLHFHLQKRKC